MPNAIVAKALRKTYVSRQKEPGLSGSVKSFLRPNTKSIHAVRGIDLEIPRGQVVAFIGPNGAGKSTTIKMLTGILHPTSGDAKVLGYTPWRDRERLAMEIGAVFGQKSQLWYHLPPNDTFSLLRRIYEMEEGEFERRRAFLIEAFEIGPYVNEPVRKLSLGERMRCEVAASLLHGPKVIFLDEPTIGLDVIARQNVRRTLRIWNDEEKATVFLTSHDVGDIESLAQRVVVVNHGQVVMDAPMKELKYRYMDRKIVDLRLRGQNTVGEMSGVTVLKRAPLGLKLEVDTKRRAVGEVISEILRQSEVEDITVSDRPLADIIASIYKESEDGPR